jgi:hypothetical protein
MSTNKAHNNDNKETSKEETEEPNGITTGGIVLSMLIGAAEIGISILDANQKARAILLVTEAETGAAEFEQVKRAANDAAKAASSITDAVIAEEAEAVKQANIPTILATAAVAAASDARMVAARIFEEAKEAETAAYEEEARVAALAADIIARAALKTTQSAALFRQQEIQSAHSAVFQLAPTMYRTEHTPNIQVGKLLGKGTWPGSIALAIELAKNNQFGNPCSSLKYVQKVDSVVYFYGHGVSSGKGGSELWTCHPLLSFSISTNQSKKKMGKKLAGSGLCEWTTPENALIYALAHSDMNPKSCQLRYIHNQDGKVMLHSEYTLNKEEELFTDSDTMRIDVGLEVLEKCAPGSFGVVHYGPSMNDSYRIVSTPNHACGTNIGTNNEWKSIECALNSNLDNLEISIQKSGGVCYIYEKGDQSGSAGAECWTLGGPLHVPLDFSL